MDNLKRILEFLWFQITYYEKNHTVEKNKLSFKFLKNGIGFGVEK
jgi:hypothetical protein